MRPFVLALFAAAAFAQQIDFYRQLKNGPVFSTSYQFEIGAAAISGSLASAGAKTLTLKNSPAGVSGTNTQHYLYISGGTGTAEAVLITGGTCVGMQVTSCTLSFTTANTHTGSWTIKSATAGMKEAYQAFLQANPSGELFRMHIPQGNHHTYSCFYAGDRSIFLTGDGPWVSRIYAHNLSLCAISAINTTVDGYTFNLSGIGIFPSGGVFGAGVASLYVQTYPIGGIQDYVAQSPGIGIDWNNTAIGGNPLTLSNISVFAASNRGMRLRSTGAGQQAGMISNFYCDGPGSIGLELIGTTAGFTITNVWTQATAYGILIDGTTRNTNEITIDNSILDGPTTAGIQILGQSITAGTNHIQLSNSLIQHDSASYGAIIQSTTRVSLNGVKFNSNSSSPSIAVNTSSRVSIFDVRLHSNSSNTSPMLLSIFGPSDNVDISGLVMTADAARTYGVNISAEANTNITISNSYSQPSFTQAVLNASTSGPVKLKNNVFNDSISAVASAATISLPTVDDDAAVSISGTTNITRITGGYNGRRVRFIMQGALTFNTGGANPGDIAVALGPTVAGQVVFGTYNATDGKWYLK